MQRLARPVLRAFAARLYRDRPLQEWPRWAGDALDVKLPNNLPRKAEPSPSGGANINIILDLLRRTHDVPGDVAECGVFRAASLCVIGLHLTQIGSVKRVYGLDSFQGFDASVKRDLELGGADDSEKRVGGFESTSLAEVRHKVTRLGLAGCVTLLPGYFADTLKLLPETRYSFVHLDCDIYDSYWQTLAYFYPRMSAGGIILLDEYNDPPWPGCNLAVDEFLADKPEKPVAITNENYIKYYIEKAAETSETP
jgi:O-methyltransferase